jgi:hypothetical protein
MDHHQQAQAIGDVFNDQGRSRERSISDAAPVHALVVAVVAPPV